VRGVHWIGHNLIIFLVSIYFTNILLKTILQSLHRHNALELFRTPQSLCKLRIFFVDNTDRAVSKQFMIP